MSFSISTRLKLSTRRKRFIGISFVSSRDFSLDGFWRKMLMMWSMAPTFHVWNASSLNGMMCQFEVRNTHTNDLKRNFTEMDIKTIIAWYYIMRDMGLITLTQRGKSLVYTKSISEFLNIGSTNTSMF